jgi:hypothetical protein
MIMLLGLAVAAGACFRSERDPDADDGDPGSANAPSGGGNAANGDDGASSDPARPGSPGDPCSSGTEIEIASYSIDKIDLLFVVDNSGSMREEQAALRQQFPRLLRALASGDLDSDGQSDFAPARDVHLGVVSSDMGLVGIESIPGCTGLGDDGVMNNVPDPAIAGCQATYPRFLSYSSEVNDPEQIASDFACVASLGTEGCGFEQQLEAGLKALWPSVDIDPTTGQPLATNRIQFLGDINGFGQLGHGDLENAGFLRNDPVLGISLISIVVVSDEEDCSSQETRHFTPDIYLDPSDPLASQDLNLRCFHNPQNLYNLERYVNGFKALRPGNEQLVTFAAIVGVPPELVSEDALAGVDFTDDGARGAFYDRILSHERMQEVIDGDRTPEQGGNLVPSCIGDTGRAYPPRRIVELARRFGENGYVGSICQPDFAFPIDGLVRTMARQLGAVCLPRPLVRGDGGLTACELVWHLPPPNLAPTATPTSCNQRDFLSAPTSGSSIDQRGGEICSVRQLPVLDAELSAGGEDGWYYDDFSDRVERDCRGGQTQRIEFTPEAYPPSGVSVRLRCGQPDDCR